MKFAYRFSNLLGTVYRRGNLTFTPDGNSLLSPVGNRITVFDLKNNKSQTLPVESQLNITALALSPDGTLLIAVNEEGEAVLVNLISRSVLHHYKFHRPVHAIAFSPDGKKFAVTKENKILVFHAPGRTKEYNPFVLYRTYFGAYEENVCIDWTSDSRAFCAGSKDMTTRVYAAQKCSNLVVHSLGGHTAALVAAFFEQDSLDVYSLARNGQLCVWKCQTKLEGLKVVQEDQVVEEQPDGQTDTVRAQSQWDKEKQAVQEAEEKKLVDKILFSRVSKFSYRAARGEGARKSKVTSAAYHKQLHILVTGFKDGAFFLHEMPEFNLIHSLRITNQAIDSVVFNKPGEWLALGSTAGGQLLVWEWQSETYVLKQQGHFNNMTCLAYSPDGQYIVTGGEDGKVKVWQTGSGFCFVTFKEHNAGITGVAFNQNGQVVLSASLDGTVRAFDLNRYRNFRTFTSPRPAQFSCLAVDHSGEVVCAGGQDMFEIFMWSIQTGRLLEVLAGHEGPISSLAFSSSQSLLASSSWDKTVKLWDIYENKGARETLSLTSDALAVTFRPDGEELAVSTLNGHVTFWDVRSAIQTGSVEGRHDLGYTRGDTDLVTAKQLASGKAFTSLCYTADGSCILAGGKSKNVCIYSVKDQLLVKKFEISCNMSFDGMQEHLDRRKMTEWGSLALMDDDQEEALTGHSLSLPGVRSSDMSSRNWRPHVCVSSVRFSPTGREWAATSTEGLLVYSLDHSLVFDPYLLEVDITPQSIRQALKENQHAKAIMLACKLNEQHLIRQAVEAVPVSDIEYLSQSLPDVYVDRLLQFVGAELEASRHLEFYLRWCERLLVTHGVRLKQRSHSIMPIMRMLHKHVNQRYQQLSSVCDHNKYSLQYILSLAELRAKPPPTQQPQVEEDVDSVQSDDSDDDFMGIEL